MHFWIDKRSQTCGFGRARVAASLSGSGFDFGHPPRRIGGKSLVAPIHRFQPVDYRPYLNRQNHHSHHTNSNSNSNHPNTNNSSSSSSGGGTHSTTNTSRQTNGRHSSRTHSHNGPQRVNVAQNARPHHMHRNAYETTAQINAHYRQPADYTAVVQQFNQSHALELEQGPLGINALGSPRTVIVNDGPNAVTVATNDSQILPSHLKCGMWASLALVTVFLAVFQGTGLEVLIFCTFSATFFLAACTVSLCRRPRNVNISTPQISPTPSPNVIEHIQQIDQMDQIDAQLSNPSEVINVDMMSASPPPYHIAIMATKDIDESPPPAYHAIMARKDAM